MSFYYSDTDHYANYFSGNTYYHIKDGVVSAEVYLKSQLPEMINEIKDTPLRYGKGEKITSSERDAM